MFLELLSVFSLKRKEQFAEGPQTEVNNIYATVGFVALFIWVFITLMLYVRINMLAFKCEGFSRGMFSVLLPSHYTLLKIGDLIKLTCK